MAGNKHFKICKKSGFKHAVINMSIHGTNYHHRLQSVLVYYMCARGGLIHRKYCDVSLISIISVSYRISVSDIGFSIYHYRIGDKWNISNFWTFYHTFAHFLALI